MSVQLVWFKRDLRISDHRPLYEATKRGIVLAAYVFEPSLWRSPEMDASHFDFIAESLIDLEQRLTQLGIPLVVQIGELPDAFVELSSTHAIACLTSHEETGNRLTYDRDRRVAKWAGDLNIPWLEYPQNGVVRRLKSRDGWSSIWNSRMMQPLAPKVSVSDGSVRPQHHSIAKEILHTASIRFFGNRTSVSWLECDRERSTSLTPPPSATLSPSCRVETFDGIQRGGESKAKTLLQSFLNQRGIDYQRNMSSPNTAFEACSRLSPYIAWGCISVKQVFQETMARASELRQTNTTESRWSKSIRSFSSRLSWHCHFIQKLEDQPSLEFENMSRVFDGLREDEFSSERFEAWTNGHTGYPMIDACMRSLHEHRWINFRMRAMLMSFASNHLWLHWRPTALHLAKLFLDFEPGIHFSQAQMQSGTTGINTIRIYSPTKQAIEHDPKGEFIKRYVPELSHVPTKYISEPHRMPVSVQHQVGCRIGIHYPAPIVDHLTAYRLAQQKIYSIRGTDAAVAAAQAVYKKHGSRKRQDRDPLPLLKPKSGSPVQLSLFDFLDEEESKIADNSR